MANSMLLLCLLVTLCPWATIAQFEGDVRLVGGSSSMQGRVEIYHNYQWGTVCDDYWDDVDASVVCRQLGYDHATRAYDRAYFGEGNGQPIYLDNVDCTGFESRLTDCYNRGWGVNSCGHSEDAGATCTNSLPEYGDIRLSDGRLLEEGRIEIYYNGQWGTVCNDYWGYNEARVTCNQLGYNGVSDSQTLSFGPGSGPIHLDNVFCYGSESKLAYCSHDGWGQTQDCSHYEDVGVRCYRSGTGMSGWLIAVIVISSIFVFGALVAILAKVCSSSKKRRTTRQDHDTSNVVYSINGNNTAVATTTALPYPVQTGMQPYPPQVGMQPYPPQAGGQPYPPAMAYPNDAPPSYSLVNDAQVNPASANGAWTQQTTPADQPQLVATAPPTMDAVPLS